MPRRPSGSPRTSRTSSPLRSTNGCERTYRTAADAVLIGGGGLRSISAIRALEGTLARPVLTANQVLFWHALRLAGVHEPIARHNRIFGCTLPETA